MLGVSVASDLSWNEHISSVAKSAARKIGFLFRSKRFFTPLHLLTLYEAQIRPCLEYDSHLWTGTSKYSLATLDTIQKRAVSKILSIINKKNLKKYTSKLISLIYLKKTYFYVFYYLCTQ